MKTANADNPSKDAWVAYTDGACSGNPGPMGIGIVLITPVGKHVEISNYLGYGTNNIAELEAISRAVDCVPLAAASLTLYTDSQYAIGVLQKGWKASCNREIVDKLSRLLAKRGNIQLVFVRGHNGDLLNERADLLAKAAIQNYFRAGSVQV